MKVLSAILLLAIITICSAQSLNVKTDAKVTVPKVPKVSVKVHGKVDVPKVPKVTIKVPKVTVPKVDVKVPKVHVKVKVNKKDTKVTKPNGKAKVTIRVKSNKAKVDLTGSCPQAGLFGLTSLSKPVAAKAGALCGLKSHCCKDFDTYKTTWKTWIKKQGKISWTNARIMSWTQYLADNLSSTKLTKLCGPKLFRRLQSVQVKGDVKVPKVDVKVPKVKVHVKVPKVDVKVPKVDVKVPKVKITVKKPEVKKPKVRIHVKVTKKSTKIDFNTFLKGTKCELPLKGLITGLTVLKKYNKWFVANYIKCTKAFTKFKLQSVCLACDNTKGKMMTSGMPIKSFAPVINACQDVTSFASTFGKASGLGWAGLANIAGIPYVPNTMNTMFTIVGAQKCLVPNVRKLQSIKGSAKLNVNVDGSAAVKSMDKAKAAMKVGLKKTGDLVKKGVKAVKKGTKKLSVKVKATTKKVVASFASLWRSVKGTNWVNPFKVVINQECQTQWASLLNDWMRQKDIQLYKREFFFMGQMIAGAGNAKITKEWAAFHVDSVFNPSAVKKAKVTVKVTKKPKVTVKVTKKRSLQAVSGAITSDSKNGVDVGTVYATTNAAELEAVPEQGQVSAASSKLMTVVFAMSAILLSLM
jgi:hypothetical protein